MKKSYLKLITLVVTLALVITAIPMFSASADITTGLVAHYTFDDATNLGKDTSGNGNHLSVTRGTPASVNGKFGKAIKLDGVSMLETPSKVDFTDSLTDFTISFWAQRDSAATGEMIAIGSGWRDTDPGVHLNLNDGYYCVGLRNSNNTGSWNHYNTGGTTISQIDLYTAVVSDNGTKLTMYINGKKLTEGASYAEQSGTYLMNNTNKPFSIGGLSDGGWIGWGFVGTIDDVSIYNRGLSDAEVDELYDSYSSIQVNELIAQYTFDDAENLGKDTSGKGNNLTVIGNITTAEGKSGTAAKFDGASMLRTASTADFTDSLKEFTMSFWAQRDSSSEAGEMIVAASGWRDGDGGGMQINFNNPDYLCLGVDIAESVSGGWYYPNTDFNNLQHYTVTVTQKTATIYINGAQVFTKTLGDGETFNMNGPTDRGFSIGAIYEGSYAFTGTIDEFNIYNYALTSADVAKLFSSYKEPELVAHYTFDNKENMGEDTSGKGNDLSVSWGNPTSVAGKFGSAVEFDGTSILETAGKSDFTDELIDYTISFWGQRKGTTVAAAGGLSIAMGSGWRDSTPGIQITMNDDQYFCVGLRQSSNAEAWNHYYTAGTSFSQMDFYTVTVSDGGTKLSMYINGQKVSAYIAPLTGTYLMNDAENPFGIGGLGNGGGYVGYGFIGTIDEVSIYNYSLDDAAIAKLYEDYNNRAVEGDINNDQLVDLRDLVAMKASFGGAVNDAWAVLNADFNKSGAIDAEDIRIMRKYLLGLIDNFEIQNF